jgi:hypothetical protein
MSRSTERTLLEKRQRLNAELSEIEPQLEGMRQRDADAHARISSGSGGLQHIGRLMLAQLDEDGYKKLLDQAADLEAKIADNDRALADVRQRPRQDEQAETARRNAISARYGLARLELEVALATARLALARQRAAAEMDGITPDNWAYETHVGARIAGHEAQIAALERELKLARHATAR